MDIQLEFDHLAMRVKDPEEAIAFYRRVLKAEILLEKEWREGKARIVALQFGRNRINLHPDSSDLHPRAKLPTVGGADLCFEWPGTSAQAAAYLNELDIPIEVGPRPTTGGRGRGVSVYFRDPDGNLLEFISYRDPEPA
jgi:catechol 2,3-dioxygenase-like lactoylglutathione lyase family enzyme